MGHPAFRGTGVERNDKINLPFAIRLGPPLKKRAEVKFYLGDFFFMVFLSGHPDGMPVCYPQRVIKKCLPNIAAMIIK